MNVKVESQPNSLSLVTVEVEPERVAQAKEAAFRRIAREAVVPGFRKGKAPRNLVERYIRPEAVEDDAESHLVEEIWAELQAGQFKDVQIFDTPRIKVTQHNPLVFEITLTHAPSVQLGDYKSIRIAPELVAVTDEDVNQTIERLRDEAAQWQPVQHRPVRQGDTVTLAAHGLLGMRPIVVADGFSLTVEEKANWLAPGFAMRLVGMDVDQEKEFAVQAPDDAADKEIAGATGTAYVTIKEIKEKVTPALDDAFAKTLEAETVAGLMEKVRSSLLKARETAARDRLEDKVLDEIANVSTISFPAMIVDQQVESMITQRGEYLRQRGLDINLYLQITKTTLDGMRAELRPQAEKTIRNYLLVQELEHAEGIAVEDDAIAAEIEQVVGQQQDQAAARRELSTNEMHERVRHNLRVKGLFDRLIAIVTEGQTPVGLAPAMPDVTDSVVTSPAAASAEPAKTEEEKPKLIIATH